MVSHLLNANPFPGSLLNYKAKLRLYDVTVERQTFMQLECSFETEHQVGLQLKQLEEVLLRLRLNLAAGFYPAGRQQGATER